MIWKAKSGLKFPLEASFFFYYWILKWIKWTTEWYPTSLYLVTILKTKNYLKKNNFSIQAFLILFIFYYFFIIIFFCIIHFSFCIHIFDDLYSLYSSVLSLSAIVIEFYNWLNNKDTKKVLTPVFAWRCLNCGNYMLKLYLLFFWRKLFKYFEYKCYRQCFTSHHQIVRRDSPKPFNRFNQPQALSLTFGRN